MSTSPEKFQNFSFLKKEFSFLKSSTSELKKPIELTKEKDKFLLEILKKAREEEKKGNLVEAIKLYQEYKEKYLKLKEEEELKKEKEEKIETEKESEEGKIIGMEIIEGTEVEFGGSVFSCSLSPDGTFAIIGSGNNIACLAEIKRDEKGKITGMEIIKGTEVKVEGVVYSCSLSPDGTFAIIGSSGSDYIIRLAEIKKDKEGKITRMEIIKGTEIKVEGYVRSCSISPDGTFAIIGSDGGIACLAEIKKDKKGKIIGMEIIKETEVEVRGSVYSCSLSPDGTFAIIGSNNNIACLAEIKRDEKGKITEMKIIEGTKVKVGGSVYSCSLSPDGTFAIIGSDGGIACLAEIKKDKEGKITEMEIIKGTEAKVGGSVYSCSLSPDGTFAIIGSANCTACLAEIKREKI